MINICLSEELKSILNKNDIDPSEYVPAYGGESAGLDLYNCGATIHIPSASHKTIIYDDTKKFKNLIPTGLRISVPKGYVALIQERGSIIKTPLKVRAGVIDSGYTGEVFVNCINTGESTHTFFKNSKLPFQLIVVKCDNIFNEVSEEEYLNLTISSLRKEGNVGSSD